MFSQIENFHLTIKDSLLIKIAQLAHLQSVLKVKKATELMLSIKMIYFKQRIKIKNKKIPNWINQAYKKL